MTAMTLLLPATVMASMLVRSRTAPTLLFISWIRPRDSSVWFLDVSRRIDLNHMQLQGSQIHIFLGRERTVGFVYVRHLKPKRNKSSTLTAELPYSKSDTERNISSIGHMCIVPFPSFHVYNISASCSFSWLICIAAAKTRDNTRTRRHKTKIDSRQMKYNLTTG